MFIGHYAVALGAKKAAPPVKLGTLVFAAQFLDLLWPLLLLAGIEHVQINAGATPFTRLDFLDYPVSHSLLTSIFWSLLIGGAYYLLHKQKLNSIIVGCAVLSHWILDLISHTPDLPLVPGLGVVAGFGLWHSTIATIIVETMLFITGIALYIHATRPKDGIGKYAPWTLIVFLSIVYIASIISPPPPNSHAIAFAGLLGWLFIPWAYWIDRHRQGKIEERNS